MTCAWTPLLGRQPRRQRLELIAAARHQHHVVLVGREQLRQLQPRPAEAPVMSAVLPVARPPPAALSAPLVAFVVAMSIAPPVDP